MHKILYAEDEESLAMIVKDTMEVRGYEVMWCKDGKAALIAFQNDKPDICVFDIMMPEMDGLSLAKEVRRLDSLVPIIFLSAKSQTTDVLTGFESGANDYIKKPFSIDELLIRIKNILSRDKLIAKESPLDSSTFILGEYTFNYATQELHYQSEKVNKLTSKENEILRMLCENKNNILKRSIVLTELWGDDGFFTARSMDVFITKLRKYLKRDPRLEIINIRGIGFKLIAP
ncbi:MAG: response regulator transcription factor [Marinifilaceae bacterium]|jgi:DNA-binding response OmpR family regulator